MPLPDGLEDSTKSSRASSRDRNVSSGYNVLYLAASLFEFNISATKSEAGYPYLTYQAGEVFLAFLPQRISANFSRSSMSSAKKASFGLLRIKTTFQTESVGSGANTSHDLLPTE
jgi:hypothetical protein